MLWTKVAFALEGFLVHPHYAQELLDVMLSLIMLSKVLTTENMNDDGFQVLFKYPSKSVILVPLDPIPTSSFSLQNSFFEIHYFKSPTVSAFKVAIPYC